MTINNLSTKGIDILPTIFNLEKELKRKQNTPIKMELLKKNGFEYKDITGYNILVKFGFDLCIVRDYLEDKNYRFYIYDPITDSKILRPLNTVADLEDVMELCGIYKEIDI